MGINVIMWKILAVITSNIYVFSALSSLFYLLELLYAYVDCLIVSYMFNEIVSVFKILFSFSDSTSSMVSSGSLILFFFPRSNLLFPFTKLCTCYFNFQLQELCLFFTSLIILLIYETYCHMYLIIYPWVLSFLRIYI